MVPEDLKDVHGTRPVSLEDGGEAVEDFVKELRAALTSEMRVIRETNLDLPLETKRVRLHYIESKDSSSVKVLEAQVDKLDRVHIPASAYASDLYYVSFPEEDNGNVRKYLVVSKESRFVGDEEVTIVLCLNKGDQNVTAGQT